MTVYGFGEEEGEICGRRGCDGRMGAPLPNGRCGCGDPGAMPPCWGCENSRSLCDGCGMGVEDDSDCGPPPAVTPEMWERLVKALDRNRREDGHRIQQAIWHLERRLDSAKVLVAALEKRIDALDPTTAKASVTTLASRMDGVTTELACMSRRLTDMESRLPRQTRAGAPVAGGAAFVRGIEARLPLPAQQARQPAPQQPTLSDDVYADERFGLIDLGDE